MVLPGLGEVRLFQNTRSVSLAFGVDVAICFFAGCWLKSNVHCLPPATEFVE